jgi:hypothetical protein
VKDIPQVSIFGMSRRHSVIFLVERLRTRNYCSRKAIGRPFPNKAHVLGAVVKG